MCFLLIDRLFSNASEHAAAVQKTLQVANSTRNEQSPVSRCKCCKLLTSSAIFMSVLQLYDPQMAIRSKSIQFLKCYTCQVNWVVLLFLSIIGLWLTHLFLKRKNCLKMKFPAIMLMRGIWIKFKYSLKMLIFEWCSCLGFAHRYLWIVLKKKNAKKYTYKHW